MKKEEAATLPSETETKNSTEPIEEEKEETKEDNQQNRPKDLTEPIHLEEQQDLFRAIFLSDSENEEETKSEEIATKNEDEVRKEEIKSSVLSDQLIPKIKPLREGGVLSGINFRSMKKREEPKKDEETETDRGKEEEKKLNLYGPKMPEILMVATPKTNSIIKEESEDEWVEKNDSSSDEEGKRRKEKKKHKKEKKHKHKKHKHKKKTS